MPVPHGYMGRSAGSWEGLRLWDFGWYDGLGDRLGLGEWFMCR